MISIYLLILFVILDVCLGQSCPPGFTYCSAHGEACQTGGTGDGLISYGINGRWSLMAISNTCSNLKLYQCDHGIFGDPYFGINKVCCYKFGVSTGFNGISWSYYKSHGQTYNLRISPFNSNNLYAIRYGIAGKYTYKYGKGSNIQCNHYTFGDPYFGINKGCNAQSVTTMNGITPGWSFCAFEGHYCNGLIPNKMTWIRYGANGYWYYVRVYTTLGSVQCWNELFDDPIGGVSKSCQICTNCYQSL